MWLTNGFLGRRILGKSNRAIDGHREEIGVEPARRDYFSGKRCGYV